MVWWGFILCVDKLGDDVMDKFGGNIENEGKVRVCWLILKVLIG